MIVWDDEFSTGVDYIDKQHQHLIDNFNNFVEAVAQNRGREHLAEMLGYLQFYTEWHFNREERCMHDHKCPAAMKNKKAHTIFLGKLEALSEHYREEDTDPHLVDALVEELGTWIINHILHIDTKLSTCGVTPAYSRTQEIRPYNGQSPQA